MATSYTNPGVTVSVINTPVITSTANNPVNICIMGDVPVTGNTTDVLTFKYSNSYNQLSSNYVTQDTVTKKPLITKVVDLSGKAYTLGVDYQASWVNGTTVIAGMPAIRVTGDGTPAPYTLTNASGTGTVQTYTSSFVGTQPFVVGSTVTVTSITGTGTSGYNVTAATITAVSGSSGAWTFSVAGTATATPSGYGSASTPVALSGSFTLTFYLNGTSTTFTTGNITYSSTLATLASNIATAVQSAARTATGDTGLTVTGSVGPDNVETVLTVVPSNYATQNIITLSSATTSFVGGTSPAVSTYATTTGLKGQTLQATYSVDNNSAYGNKLIQFNSNSGVVAQFGSALNTTSTSINSPVTLAAQLAFSNGASQVWVFPVKRSVPTAASTVSDWNNAFTALQTVNGIGNIDTIVPLIDYTITGFDRTQFASYLNYQKTNSSILQRMFISQDTSTSNVQANTAILQNDAVLFGNQRISLVAPTSIQIPTSSTATNSTLSIGGFYLAAALAGLFSSLPGPQEPLTHKTVQGFSTINPPISVRDYVNLQTYGVLCTKQKADGTMYVRHGLTTDTTNWLTEEISIIAAQDALYNNIKNTLDNSTVIGSALTQNTANAVVSIVQGVLTNAVNTNLIQSYQGLQFAQSTTLPTTITVTFSYSPTFPLNYVNVTFSINPTAGTVSFNTVSNAFNTTTGV